MVSSPNLIEIFHRAIGTLSYILPIIFFIILAIYYRSKVGDSNDANLILIGNIIILIVAILHQFIFSFIESWGHEVYLMINSALNFISFIGSILFLIGFYMMIKKIVQNKNLL